MGSRCVIMMVLGLVVLSGCNAEERERPLRLDKGGYSGAPDQVISETTRIGLRHRAALQAEGPARVMVDGGEAVMMPAGGTAASGRIVGQNF